MSKRAVILAGGKGTRLRPYSITLPKPLMPLGEYPIVEIIIRQLARAGFEHITLAVNHHRELIQAFFQDGAKWNLKIDYSLEDQPLSTMGPLRLIPDLPEDFLVMNGDVLTDIDYAALFQSHKDKGNMFTISSYLREELTDFGVLHTNDEGYLVGFEEKPRHQYEVSMGIYIVNRKALECIPPNQPYGFDHLMNDLLRDKRLVSVCRHNGYWMDIGRPDDYARAIEEFDTLQNRFMNG